MQQAACPARLAAHMQVRHSTAGEQDFGGHVFCCAQDFGSRWQPSMPDLARLIGDVWGLAS